MPSASMSLNIVPVYPVRRQRCGTAGRYGWYRKEDCQGNIGGIFRGRRTSPSRYRCGWRHGNRDSTRR